MPRLVLSLIFGPEHAPAEAAGLTGAEARGNVAPAIRIDLVALHEFGHALGLDHTSDVNSIMYAYYNANYNIGNLANDSATATLRQLYADVSTSPQEHLTPASGAMRSSGQSLQAPSLDFHGNKQD